MRVICGLRVRKKNNNFVRKTGVNKSLLGIVTLAKLYGLQFTCDWCISFGMREVRVFILDVG